MPHASFSVPLMRAPEILDAPTGTVATQFSPSDFETFKFAVSSEVRKSCGFCDTSV